MAEASITQGRTSGLRADPVAVVGSLSELYAVAHMLAAQAVRVYQDLSARMADLGNEDARRAFDAITAEQRRYAVALEARTPPELRGPPAALARWANLVIFEDEDLSRTRLVTPYRALATAVRNEECAFAFWTYISARYDDPEVCAAAERLALDELAHIRILREARRRAYHEAHRPDGGEVERLRTLSLSAFRDEAAEREAALAELHAGIARHLAKVGDPRADALAEVSAAEEALARSLGRGEETVNSAGEAIPHNPDVSFGLALERLEAAADFYLDVAETCGEEDTVAEAQRLSEKTVRHLAALTG